VKSKDEASRLRYLILLSALACVASVAFTGCFSRPPLPTVEGPEAQDLIRRATGCVVFDHPVAGINAIGVRDLKEAVVRAPNPTRALFDTVDFVAGPDADDWVVFIANNMDAKTHSMRAIKMNGTEETQIFDRPGDANWDDPMSAPVLAPRGGNVAFLTQPVKPFAPAIVSGPIDVWNIHTKAEHDTHIEALNRGLSWFPDGKRLTYVQLGEPETVYVLDVESGERKPLHKGGFALVSTDGESVLVNTEEGDIINTEEGNIIVDVKTGESRKVDWPGKYPRWSPSVHWGGPIALIDKDLILYWGLPTTGAAPKVTENNSPLVGPKPMGTLKLADLSSEKFQTVVPYVDPRRELSFGISGACP
jgi:hypothetical protein